MRTLTIEIDEALYEALVAAGPTPEEAAARSLAATGRPESVSTGAVSAWRRLCDGLGETGTGANLSDTVDSAVYGRRP